MQSRIMKTHHLHSEVWLPSPRDQVFRFFADPKNLQQLTPNWLHFEILSPEGKIEMGTLLDYRLKLRGMPLRWQSEISVWQPLHRFVDRQTKGPYRLWVHEHTFVDDRGGTLVRDHVEYAVPGGSLIQRILVAPDLVRIFDYRRHALRKVFHASPTRAQFFCKPSTTSVISTSRKEDAH
jgi:ligand-binding SRPBCC domain-containing protein